jgi:hypothetical protein
LFQDLSFKKADPMDCNLWLDARTVAGASALRVSALVAAGILFQPVQGTLRAGGIFYFHSDSARICAAVDASK